MSAAFDPTGKYVSTAAWDRYAKIWDASTGAEVARHGPTTGQNWLTSFSPDGRFVLVTVGSGTVHVYPAGNNTGTPFDIGYGAGEWIRSAAWSPDGQYLATGSQGKVLVWKFPEAQVVQNYTVESSDEINGLVWLEDGKQLSYRLLGGGLEVYDFDTNLKYRFGPTELDHYGNGVSTGSTHVLKSKGWIGGIDSDSKVRFWKWSA
jgi:WD40 repeat protein